MKKINDSLLKYLREYLTVFLPKQTRRSPHTILATKQVWNMLLLYICGATKKRVENLTFADLNQNAILHFLDDMQQTRGWSPATRNNRLARIRSFFRYVAGIEPTLAMYFEEARNIKLQKDVNKAFVLDYMTKDAVAALLRQPDASNKLGIRDMFFMVLMYDSAARDSEMLTMSFGDLDPVGKTVYLLGKGNKPRNVPINADTINHFYRYAKLYHPTSDQTIPMFYTIRHGERGPMSDDNVARLINHYSKLASAKFKDFPEKVHPHKIRRSRAMHLYQSGMPLEMIAQFLGHNDPLTTLIYARADNEMKRKAIDRAEAISSSIDLEPEKAAWFDNDELIKTLLGLYV